MDIDNRLELIEKDLSCIRKAESPFKKYIVQVATLIFIIGGGWTSLNYVMAQAQDNKDKIEEVQKEAKEVAVDIGEIKNEQKNLSKDVEKLDSKLDKILEELRKDNG